MNDKIFIVTGATSGFGEAIAVNLINNGFKVCGNSRTEANLKHLENKYKGYFYGVSGDIMSEKTQKELFDFVEGKDIQGLVVNAGGPVPGSFEDLEMADWDVAYNLVLKWKVSLLKRFLPKMQTANYGRVVFIESMSVRQPIPNLLLSNVFRLSVVGLAKSLSQQYARNNITFNTVAPGYHSTPALERVIMNKSRKENKTREEVVEELNKKIPVGRLGKADELASLVSWLLSSEAGYATGQIYPLDGGVVVGY